MPTDREAFEALVVRCQATVSGVAFSVLRDRARSEEVAQDAFLIAWRDRAVTEPTVGWVCGIARNLARNAARRRTELAMTNESERDARDALIAREDVASAIDALGRLPESLREAVVVYYRSDESYDQVASALGISEVSARQRVSRGRKALRDLVGSVASTLRATKPGVAFTAAVVAAWTLGATPAHAATATATKVAWLMPTLIAGAVATASIAGVAIYTVRHARTTQASTARSAIGARYPAMSTADPPALPPNVVALATDVVAAPATPRDLLELDIKAAPILDLAVVFSQELDMPIWVTDPMAGAKLELVGKKTAIDFLDESLAQSHGVRVESAALRIVPDGHADASSYGGETMSVTVTAMPLSLLVPMIVPKLGMPVGFSPLIPLNPNDDANGERHDGTPLITLDVHDEPAGLVLEQALEQAHFGCELTTGFVIVPADVIGSE